MALVLAPESPLPEWLAALDAQIERSPSFFDNRPVVLDLAALPREQPNIAGLFAELDRRGIHIIGSEGAHPSWKDIPAWGRPLPTGGRPAREIEPPPEPRRAAAAAVAPPPPPPVSAADAGSLLVEQSVRSGQSIMHERGDVIVLGSVASGAEIVAGGSVHIYGALRGRAIAGLAGNPRARIFCRRLDAELVAIDGVYQTADDMDSKLRGHAVQAWLEGDVMRMTALD